MKVLSYLIFVPLGIFFFWSCVQVDGGQEVVLIKKPWFFGHGGVDEIPVKPGLTWIALSTDSYVFSIVPIRYEERFDDMISSDNAKMDLDLFITLQIQEGKTPKLYSRFGMNWYKNNVSAPVRSKIRNLVSEYTALNLSSNKTVIDTIQMVLFQTLSNIIQRKDIPVEIYEDGIQISKVVPPDAVLKQTELTVIQKQRKLTESAKEGAEKVRKESEEARAKADDVYRKTLNMTVDQYLESQRIEILKKAAEQGKIDVIVNGSSSAFGTFKIGKN